MAQTSFKQWTYNRRSIEWLNTVENMRAHLRTRRLILVEVAFEEVAVLPRGIDALSSNTVAARSPHQLTHHVVISTASRWQIRFPAFWPFRKVIFPSKSASWSRVGAIPAFVYAIQGQTRQENLVQVSQMHTQGPVHRQLQRDDHLGPGRRQSSSSRSRDFSIFMYIPY
jgi:hypothetical protein